MRRVALAVVAVAGLVVAAPVAAHIVVAPAFLPSGGSGTLVLEVPNERGVAMVSLTVELPAGLTASTAEPVDAFTATVGNGRTVRWRGGSVSPDGVAHFTFSATATADPGTLTMRASQGYADGETVEWDVRLTITPASAAPPEQHPERAIVAAVIGVAVIVGALVLVRRSRARTSR